MLQTQKSPPVLDVSAAAPEEAGMADMVSFVIGFVRRRYLIFLFATLVGTSVGATYLRITPPNYTAKAQIMIDIGKSPFLQQQALFPDTPIDNAPQVESQIRILTSSRIAGSVVKTFHLAEDPEFLWTAGDELLPSLRERLSGSLSWLPLDVLKHDEPPKSDSDLLNQATVRLLRNLQVSRVGVSFMLEIQYRSHSAERAAQIANAIAEAYISDQMDAKYETQRRAREWLESRVNDLRQQAAEREDALNAYKANNNIVSAGGTPITEQEVAELNRQQFTAREKTSESLARLNRIESVLRSLDVGRSDSSIDGVISDVFANPIITKLRQQYLELVNREAEFSVRYGKDHAAVVTLRNQIRDTKNSMLNELRRHAESIKSDYLISKQRQESVERDLARSVAQSQETNKAQATLRELESGAHSTHALYDVFLQRYMESSQQQTFVATEARVVARAIPPDEKSSPKALSVLALSVLGGLGSGVALGFLREMLDRVFRTAQQLETVVGVPCVALVPLLKRSHKRLQTPSPGTALSGPRTIRRDAGIFWAVVESPLSSFTEGVRSIKLAADLQRADLRGVNGTVIGFTSSLPDEGKSTTAASLATLIGQVGQRVIMIDCDLRNPSLTSALAPKATAGLLEVISGEKSVEEVAWGCPETNLTFLPGTARSGLIHTGEILGSTATRKLVEQLRLSYDYIVIDLPPLAPVIDVRATAHLVDFYFLVVEWGETKIDVVEHALSRARHVYENLAGVILNKVDMNRIGRYDIYRKGFYDNKHYARYGYTT